MRIEKVMEVSDSFVRAYEYYKKLLQTKDEFESHDFVLSKVARMFGFNNIKKFKLFVMKKEKEEEEMAKVPRRNY